MEKKPDLYFGDALRRHICENLERLNERRHDKTGMRRAAVAVTLAETGHGTDIYGLSSFRRYNHQAALVLTQRAAGLKHHSGQWALPGGRREKGESAEETALRELAEEVGLELSHEHVLGRLDDFSTRSGFVITPVVIWAGKDAVFFPNPTEVAAIHRIPVQEFLRKDAPILQENHASDHPVLLMPVGNSWIAAPTAAIIYQFREVAILGRHTRVDHYDQPFFAWQ